MSLKTVLLSGLELLVLEEELFPPEATQSPKTFFVSHHCLLGLSLLAGLGFMMGSVPTLHSTGCGYQTRTPLLKPCSGSWRPTQGLSQTQPRRPLSTLRLCFLSVLAPRELPFFQASPAVYVERSASHFTHRFYNKTVFHPVEAQRARSRMRWSFFMGYLGLSHQCPIYGCFCVWEGFQCTRTL